MSEHVVSCCPKKNKKYQFFGSSLCLQQVFKKIMEVLKQRVEKKYGAKFICFSKNNILHNISATKQSSENVKKKNVD